MDIVLKVEPESWLIIPGFGAMCPDKHTISLVFKPNEDGFIDSVKNNLNRLLAHECHHLIRHRNPGCGETLLESLITEGLADHFELEISRKAPNPWSKALSESDISKYLSIARSNFNMKMNPVQGQKWFLGSTNEVPHWAGYSLGFYLIEKYLLLNPEKRPSNIVDINANEIIESIELPSKTCTLSTLDIFSQNLFTKEFVIRKPGMGELLFSHDVFYAWVEDIEIPRSCPVSNISLNGYGFYEVKVRNLGLILIPGENKFEYFLVDNYVSNPRYEKWRNKLFPNINNQYRGDINILKIEASSYFSETIGEQLLEFKPEYLLDRYTTSEVGHDNHFSNFSLPWVEGVAGDGIGEYIIIEFKKKVDEFSILNGYVDIGNMALYYENNRIKKAEITSSNSNFKVYVNFDDVVKYKKIEIPEKVKKLTIKILEVYKGSIYSDTAISGILGISQDVNFDNKSISYFKERAKID